MLLTLGVDFANTAVPIVEDCLLVPGLLSHLGNALLVCNVGVLGLLVRHEFFFIHLQFKFELKNGQFALQLLLSLVVRGVD
mmetsp:Transcript_27145/g.36278  ORF Transcript_27145/g.36278 Transcript_27145/m.36278 type:complete len:81 (+) Transcript_27145:1489-1731(+)